MTDHRDIAYARIYPPVGIARLGDSEAIEDSFVGPEWPAQRLSADPLHRYKDDEGRVKRQAARFRVYGFDSNDEVVEELTVSNADIQWTVTLANHKASWFEFRGAQIAREQFADPLHDPPPDESAWGKGPFVFRNIQVGRPDHLTKPWDRAERSRLLDINGGTRTVSGRSRRVGTGDVEDAAALEFRGRFLDKVPVYLGELRTDREGRLLVLGGRGTSGGYDTQGKPDPANWILHYANNVLWHDDSADGPVTAKVRLKKDGRDITVRGGAWVVVAPPDFAPDTQNMVTQLDVQTETAVQGNLPWPRELSGLRPDGKTVFWRDVAPILYAVQGYSWVSGLGLRGHGDNKPGDYFSDARMALLGERGGEGSRLRGFIVGRIRQPGLAPNDPTAKEQASMRFMPPLSGDEGNRRPGEPTTWLTVTKTQWEHLQRWARDDFEVGTRDEQELEPPVHEQPPALTRSSLERCVGGAFFPGIEITSIVRDPALFEEAFRIDGNKFKAGDVTQHMACPWQADFYECNTSWWPAQRPDEAVHQLDLEIIEKSFAAEQRGGSLPKLLFERKAWDRGLDTERPRPEDIVASFLPAPVSGQSPEDYLRRVQRGLSKAYDRIAYDDGTDYSGDGILLLNPWRVQFLSQERLDRFSGRYFHLRFPNPEEYLSTELSQDSGMSLGDVAERLRASWPHPDERLTRSGGEFLAGYIQFARSLRDTKLRHLLEGLFEGAKGSEDPRRAFHEILVDISKNESDRSAFDIFEEIHEDSDDWRRLAFANVLQAVTDSTYLNEVNTAGDMGMVTRWSTRGFVVQRDLPAADGRRITVFAETESHPYDGMSQAEYFYRLMNISEFSEMYSYSRRIVERVLAETERFLQYDLPLDGSAVLEHSFVFTPEAFAAKLEEIYEYYRARAASTQGWQSFPVRTRDETTRWRLLANGPFNQLDGGWLRFAADAGPVDEIHSLLFNIWSDETGNGDPALHHGNLYTTLLKSLGFYLPELSSRAYAESPLLRDEWFFSPVFELAISLHSKEFFAEILGMTLYLEWEVLDLASGVKQLDYLGYDTQFWRMHIGIDNASAGHGAQARRAVELHLENARKDGGEAAVQREWQRVWRGFIAFASAGQNYMANDADVAERRGTTVPDRLAALIQRKAPAATLNHGDKRLASNQIGDLFDEPAFLLEHLAQSQWVVRGQSSQSHLLTYLTTYSGPMYKVFDAEDLKLWGDWIAWLGREGGTGASTSYLNREQSAMALLQRMAAAASGPEGHARHWVESAPTGDRIPLQKWFADIASGTSPAELLRALREETHGYVAPYRPDQSALVVENLRVDRAMGRALDRRFSAINNQIGRVILAEWILAGCPVQGTSQSAAKQRARPRPKMISVVEKYGMGSVH